VDVLVLWGSHWPAANDETSLFHVLTRRVNNPKHHRSKVSSTMKINLPLFALAIGAFGIGVTEFSPMGMLPLIASDLGVSIPMAGLLVSAYAFGVLVGAPIMTLAFAGMARRRLLLLAMGIFTVGNLISAMADGYTMLLVGRIITSFNHGAFFGVGAVVAANIVPPEKRAGAVAAMFSGLTIATIGGVPLAAWVAEAEVAQGFVRILLRLRSAPGVDVLGGWLGKATGLLGRLRR
jgi:predicted MFS family arabinose efflux permease